MRLRLFLFACVAVAVALLALPHDDTRVEVSFPETVERPAPPPSLPEAAEADHSAVLAWNEAEVTSRRAATEAWYRAAAANSAPPVTAVQVPRDDVVAAPAAEPEPEPESPPAPVLTGGSVEDAIRTYFGDIFDQAWGVSGCESGHNPGAISPDGANYGLFQINRVHKKDFQSFTGRPWADVLDPFANAQYARHIYDNAGGWRRDWACAWAA